MPGVYPLDWWTLAHIASGMALATVGIGVWWSLGALGGFEALEYFLRMVPTGDGPLFEYESLANVVADVLVALVGYVAVRWAMDGADVRFHWSRQLWTRGGRAKP